MTTRFSSPCFRLPTETRNDTYLIQWIFWLLTHPLDQRHSPDNITLHRWANGLVSTLPVDCELDRDALMNDCRSFFAWASDHLTSWEPIREALLEFARIRPELVSAQMNVDVWDAHFLSWFIGCTLDRLEWLDENAS